MPTLSTWFTHLGEVSICRKQFFVSKLLFKQKAKLGFLLLNQVFAQAGPLPLPIRRCGDRYGLMKTGQHSAVLKLLSNELQ